MYQGFMFLHQRMLFCSEHGIWLERHRILPLLPFNFLLSKQLIRNVHSTNQQTASAPVESHITSKNQARTRHTEQIEE